MKVPFSPGDFVDCLFPFGEFPDRPGPTLHVVYCYRFFTNRIGAISTAAFYTTTAPRKPGEPKRDWIIEIAEANSRRMGMQKAFAIDTHRIGLLGLTKDFFPNIDLPGHGIRGRADEHLQKVLGRRFIEASKRPDLVQLAGPRLAWPEDPGDLTR